MTLLDFPTSAVVHTDSRTDTRTDSRTGTRTDSRTDSDTFARTFAETGLWGTPAPVELRRSQRSIDDVSVIVDGTTARLRYTTDAPLVEILVSPYRPALVDGVWVEWVLEAVDGGDFAAGGGTVDYFHRTLRPGIEYHFIITAEGEAGELPTQIVGSFSTPLTGRAA